jgi:hypothetical protein
MNMRKHQLFLLLACVCGGMPPALSADECAGSFALHQESDGSHHGTSVDSSCTKSDVRWNDEEIRGRTTKVGPDGKHDPTKQDDSLVIKKGEMRLDQKDGYGQWGGEWPDDEYTRRLPRPPLPLKSATLNEKSHSFGAFFMQNEKNPQKDMEVWKGYIEKIKARGFTIDAETYEFEKEKNGFDGHGYKAKDSAGYFVRANCDVIMGCVVYLYHPKYVEERTRKGERL